MINEVSPAIERNYAYEMLIPDCYVYSFSPAEKVTFVEHGTLYKVRHKTRSKGDDEYIIITDVPRRTKRNITPEEGLPAVTSGKFKVFWLKERDDKKADAMIQVIVGQLIQNCEENIKEQNRRIEAYKKWPDDPLFVEK